MSEREDRRELERKFPNAYARAKADDVAEKAWTENENITLIAVCAVWNDAYAEASGKSRRDEPVPPKAGG